MLETAEAVTKTQVTHCVEGEVAEPITDIELLSLPSKPAEVFDKLAHIVLNYWFLLHQCLHGKGMTQRTPLAAMIGILNGILNSRGGTNLDWSRMNR